MYKFGPKGSQSGILTKHFFLMIGEKPIKNLKKGSLKFDIRKMLCTFSFGCFQIYQNKSAKNIAIYFIGTIVSIKCMPKISAVGLFCLEKFENNQTRTCTTFFRTSKLTELYFKKMVIYTIWKKLILSIPSYDWT